MKRSNFLKSLATLIAAPSLIGKIGVDKKLIKTVSTPKAQIFYRDGSDVINEMNFIIPDYIPKLEKIYRDGAYALFLEEFTKIT